LKLLPQTADSRPPSSSEEDQKGNATLQKLRNEERVSVIYEQSGDKFEPQEADIYRLVNFLAVLRFRASRRVGHGFVSKIDAGSDLLKAVRTVCEGGRFVSQQIVDQGWKQEAQGCL
jgi:hypothetical protein